MNKHEEVMWGGLWLDSELLEKPFLTRFELGSE